MKENTKNDYGSTVFLPKTEFPMQAGLPVKEPEILQYWKDIGLHTALRKSAKDKESFILHDGPPYANGNIHIGHALNKILKDTIVRTKQMSGFDAPFVPGWDCHGLPIEWKIEEKYRELGQNKDEVPVLQFRSECRAFAAHWRDIQSEEFQRLGIIGDWKHPYTTMTNKAEAQILREMYKFLQNGILYKGVKPVMWSVVEKTALAEAEIEYQDHTSTTLWVKFPIIKTKNELLNDASVIIWTTTPWTLPANRAIAFGDFSYVVLEVKEAAESSLAKQGERYVIAESLIEDFCQSVGIVSSEKSAVIQASELEGTISSHPLANKTEAQGYFSYPVPLYQGDFVTTEAGTGFVHIAPGHGEDDFNLGKKYNIPFQDTVSDDGRYLPNVTGFAGLYVYKPDGKVGEANGAVIKSLIEQNALLLKKNVKHSYPHSWRSKAPLIFRTTPQWFIALDKKIESMGKPLRELALEAIENTVWYPGIGKNRIKGMIESRPDWCISRQRAWGVPIALFVDKKSSEVLKDSEVINRIIAAFEKEGADAWYKKDPQEFLGDKYKAKDFVQIFDILDVWFESGSTHAFCLNQEIKEVSDNSKFISEWSNLRLPADLYLEGSDQHRGWFHSSLLEGCGTLGRAPFDNVLTHGFTLDERGRKMSKSLGNTVSPQEIYEKMGADILRLWTATSDFTEDQRIGKEILKQTSDLYRRFRNTLRYLLGALGDFDTAEQIEITGDTPELEKYILHRLYEVSMTVQNDFKSFDLGHAITTLHYFCNNDLSAFYFDIRKDSLYCDRKDEKRRRYARTVMKAVFEHLVRLLAPFLSFTTEEAWLSYHKEEAKENLASVHMQQFLKAPDAWHDTKLGDKWNKIKSIRKVITGALELARNEKRIGTPLSAHIQVYLTKELNQLLKGIDLAELSICSAATVTEAPIPEDAFKLEEAEGCGVFIALAEGKKCERCWQVLQSVGSDDICPRCAKAIGM